MSEHIAFSDVVVCFSAQNVVGIIDGERRHQRLAAPLIAPPVTMNDGIYVTTQTQPWIRVDPMLREKPEVVPNMPPIQSAVWDGSRVVALCLDGLHVALCELDPTNGKATPVDLPSPIPIAWPVAPVASAKWAGDWLVASAPTLTANQHGVVACCASGVIWHRTPDGEVRAWRAPPIAGKLVGHAHAGGIVVTAIYPTAHKTDTVWLDHDGVWRDSHYSEWIGLGATPVEVGFMLASSQSDRGDLEHFGPAPARRRIVEHWTLANIRALRASPDGKRLVVMAGTTPSLAEWTPEKGLRPIDGWSSSPFADLTHEILQQGDPTPYPTWTYEIQDDPDLGRLPIPDPERVTEAIEAIRTNPAKLADLIPRLRGYNGPLEGVLGHVLDAIDRTARRGTGSASTIVRALTRRKTTSDPYMRHALLYPLPIRLRSLEIREPFAQWLDEALMKLHPETEIRIEGGVVSVLFVEIRGDLRDGSWRIIGRLDHEDGAEAFGFRLAQPLTLGTLHRTPSRVAIAGHPQMAAVIHPMEAGALVDLTDAATETSVFVAAAVRPVVVAPSTATRVSAETRARQFTQQSGCTESWLGRWKDCWAISLDPGLLDEPTCVSLGP